MVDLKDFTSQLQRGLVSTRAAMDVVKSAAAQATPTETKAGKPVKPPLDLRPAAARNKPKPKHSKFANRAGHNPPKPEFAEASEDERRSGYEGLKEGMAAKDAAKEMRLQGMVTRGLDYAVKRDPRKR